MKRLLLAFYKMMISILLFWWTASHADMELLFKGRAVQAAEKIGELKSKEPKTEKEKAKRLCETAIERAYAYFGTSFGKDKLVEASVDGKSKFFTLVLSEKEGQHEEHDLTQITLRYNKKDQFELWSMRTLADDWIVTGGPTNSLIISSKNCAYVLDMTDPVHLKSSAFTGQSSK